MAEEMTAKDAKLIQYLNEAYGKERELETSLSAHIQMTTRAPYKKRLQEHLRETKRHAREVERRIKKLGGKAEAANIPDAAPDAVGEAVTAAAGPASPAGAAGEGRVALGPAAGEAGEMRQNVPSEYANGFA